jgi:hypothetical protein
MCITYLARHQNCDKEDLLGSFHCGLGCTSDRHHTFYLYESSVNGCLDCKVLADKNSNLDLMPVRWEQGDIVEATGNRYCQNPASLSDIDEPPVATPIS